MKRLRFQAAYYFYSGKDEASVAAVMEGADVVINMVGKRYETKHLLPFDKNGKMDIWKGTRVNCRCSSSCRAPAHCHPPPPASTTHLAVPLLTRGDFLPAVALSGNLSSLLPLMVLLGTHQLRGRQRGGACHAGKGRRCHTLCEAVHPPLGPRREPRLGVCGHARQVRKSRCAPQSRKRRAPPVLRVPSTPRAKGAEHPPC